MNINLKIPLTKPDDDLTIIYKEKGKKTYEIQIEENEFFKYLRYFKERRIEILQTKNIFIQDDIDTKIFESFISSIQTKEININDNNYKQLYHLSNKYGYEELKKQIEQFIKERPDLNSIIEEISTNQNESKSTRNKEYLVAKNLDLCIQSGFLDNVDIKTIVRIINSPKRHINDHHLLYNFVIKLIQKSKNIEINNKQEKYYQILPSALDYNQMSNDEITQLLKFMGDESFFSPLNANEKMKDLISHSMANVQEDLETKLKTLQMKITEIEKKHQNEIYELQDKLRIKSKQIDNLLKEFDKKKLMQQNNDSKQINENYFEDEENGLIIIYYDNNKTNALKGIISYLGKGNGLSAVENGIIDITASSINGKKEFFKPINALNYKDSKKYFASDDEAFPWLCIDFKDYKVNLSHYSIQTSGVEGIHPDRWEICASQDKSLWVLLDKRNSDNQLDSLGVAGTYEISKKNNQYYRYFRFLQNHNSMYNYYCKSNNILMISSIEFFGKIKKIKQ